VKTDPCGISLTTHVRSVSRTFSDTQRTDSQPTWFSYKDRHDLELEQLNTLTVNVTGKPKQLIINY